MNTTNLFYFIIIDVCLIFATLLLTFHSWFKQFRPDLYKQFKICENDYLNIKNHLIFTPLDGNKEIYKFNECEYNCKGFKPYIEEHGIYTWYFEKDKNLPISFQKQDVNISGKLINEVKKQSLDDLWFNDSGIEDFLKNYGVVIVGIILIGVMLYMVTQQQQSTQLLLNATLSRG